jgi:hypothetical protein
MHGMSDMCQHTHLQAANFRTGIRQSKHIDNYSSTVITQEVTFSRINIFCNENVLLSN